MKALTIILKAQRSDMTSPLPGSLYNLTMVPSSGPVKGTLKYQGQWNTI